MWIIYNIHTFIYSHIYMQVLFIGGTCMTLLSAPGPHTFHGTPAATATSCQASEEETGSGFKTHDTCDRWGFWGIKMCRKVTVTCRYGCYIEIYAVYMFILLYFLIMQVRICIYIVCFDPTQYVIEVKEQDVRCSHDSTVGLLQNKLKPDPIV